MLEAGFTPDDYFIDMSEPLREGSAGGSGGEDAAPAATGSSYLLQEYDIDIYGLAPDKMSYTEQANKRTHCKRLTKYVAYALTGTIIALLERFVDCELRIDLETFDFGDFLLY